MRSQFKFFVFAACLAPAMAAADITYTEWDLSTATSSSVSGTLQMGDGTVVGVTLTGPLYFVQDSTGTNYFGSNPETYEGPGIPNAPETGDIIAIREADASYTFTFSQPVYDLVMPIVSVGRNGIPVEYQFSRDFILVNSGPGYFGTGTLTKDGFNLAGEEGNGVMLFDGTFSSFSWTVDEAESWHGFTLGAGGAVPEPGTMAVLGLGALALLKRRKKA